jgi:glycosyltransferase involved in cell wall biosynthesis
VSASNVCVIPLRYGSGTRIKALESMALGTPIVSTTKGVEGIDVEDGVHVLIADEPELFASHVIRLLTDTDLARVLAKNARRLMLDKYTWSKVGKRFSDFCESFHPSKQ